MAEVGVGVEDPPPIPRKMSKSQSSALPVDSSSNGNKGSPDDQVTSTSNENGENTYSHLKHEGMEEESEGTEDLSAHPYSKLTIVKDLPSPADTSSERDLPSDWIVPKGKPPDLPPKISTTSQHKLSLNLPSYGSKSRSTRAYEQFTPTNPASDGGLNRAPSLEWDTADLPPPLPPKPSDLVSNTTDQPSHDTLTPVQEEWHKQHEEYLKNRSYDTIEIPAVQQKWITEHDHHRQARSYEDVEGVQWNLRPHSSPSNTRQDRPSTDHVEGDVPPLLQSEVEALNRSLPEGWEADVQDGQIVYWHINTGKVQLARPTGGESTLTSYSTQESKDDLRAVQELVAKRQGHRTHGSYMGWVDIPSHEVVSGNLVSTAQRAISHVLKGRRVSESSEGEEEYEGGQGVCLEIKGGVLQLFNIQTMTPIRTQLLSDIKVFAIGRDNDRNFGYIAYHSDVDSCKCHVFRLKSPAQNFVGAVLSHVRNDHNLPTQGWTETVKETLHEDRLRHLSGHSTASNSSNSIRDRTPSSDDLDRGLDGEDTDLVSNPNSDVLVDQEFNSYDYKRFECFYMGNVKVSEAFGQLMVYEALSKMSVDKTKWMAIYIDISPQCIRLVDKDASGLSFAEHRVRFISFLGFGANDKTCGFVVDCGDSDYQCYGIYAEPNCEQLCLQLHLACQERFERVLEAHPEAKAIQDTLKKENKPQSWIGRLWNRRSYHQDHSSGGVSTKELEGHRFTVHYLGSQVFPTFNDSETALSAIESIASSSSSPTSTVQLEVTPTGLTLYDPGKLLFKRKHFSAKDISYLLGKDKYLAFVCDEAGSSRTTHRCHVIKTGEFEVDVKVIVRTIKSTLSDSQ